MVVTGMQNVIESYFDVLFPTRHSHSVVEDVSNFPQISEQDSDFLSVNKGRLVGFCPLTDRLEQFF